MQTFKIFKTKIRNWCELIRTLNYGKNHQNVKEIGEDFYKIIMEKLKKEKTDGVIINEIAGTIGLNSKFIPFIKSELTIKEREEIKKIIEN